MSPENLNLLTILAILDHQHCVTCRGRFLNLTFCLQLFEIVLDSVAFFAVMTICLFVSNALQTSGVIVTILALIEPEYFLSPENVSQSQFFVESNG